MSAFIVNDNQYHLNVFLILILIFSLLTIFMLIISVHDKNAQSLKGRGLGDK